MEKRTPFDKLIYVLAFLPLIVTIILYSSMPDEIPVHYDAAGVVDKMGKKPMVFFMPLLSLMCVLPINLVKDFVDNKKLFNASRLITALFMDALCLEGLYSAYNNVQSVPISKIPKDDITYVLCGVFFIVLGIMSLKKEWNNVNQNQKHALTNDIEILNKSNKVIAKLLIVCGIVFILVPVFLPSEKTSIMIYTFIVMFIVPISYPLYLEHKKKKK